MFEPEEVKNVAKEHVVKWANTMRKATTALIAEDEKLTAEVEAFFDKLVLHLVAQVDAIEVPKIPQAADPSSGN